MQQHCINDMQWYVFSTILFAHQENRKLFPKIFFKVHLEVIHEQHGEFSDPLPPCCFMVCLWMAPWKSKLFDLFIRIKSERLQSTLRPNAKVVLEMHIEVAFIFLRVEAKFHTLLPPIYHRKIDRFSRLTPKSSEN